MDPPILHWISGVSMATNCVSRTEVWTKFALGSWSCLLDHPHVPDMPPVLSTPESLDKVPEVRSRLSRPTNNVLWWRMQILIIINYHCSCMLLLSLAALTCSVVCLNEHKWTADDAANLNNSKPLAWQLLQQWTCTIQYTSINNTKMWTASVNLRPDISKKRQHS